MMKKIVALILAAALLCSFASALADGVPHKESFADMKTKVKGNFIYITLTKPVDKLYANWAGELKVVELLVNENLQATLPIVRHPYQVGVELTDSYTEDRKTAVSSADANDRAYITLQGDWIVCYNRKGAIVDIIAAKTYDIDDILNAAAF